MSRLRRWTSVVLAAVVFVASTPVGGTLALEPVAGVDCGGHWQSMVFGDSLAGMEPQAVATLSGQPAWTVGLASAVAINRRPMLAEWTGNSWQRVPGPWKSYGILNAVEATSATNAWTIGATGSYVRWPISGRWNGSTWSAVPVPQPDGESATFADMALIKGQQLWAVGSKLQNGRSRPLAMKHVATGWTVHDPDVSAGVEAGLSDVTRAPGGRIWAAGWKADLNGQGRGWIIYRNSGGWRTTPLATLPAGRAAITDLTFRSASNGWAAGFVETASGGYQPILQRWNGNTWANQPVPWAAGRSIILNAVEATADGRLTVAGIDVQQLRTDILATRTGSSWQVTSNSPGTIEISSMADLAPLSTGIVAVGAVDRQPVALVQCVGSSAGLTPSDVLDGSAESVAPAAPDHLELSDASEPHGSGTSLPGAVALPGTVALDRTIASGLQMSVPTWSGLVADYNDDGFDDVFINLHWEFEPRLMLGSASGVFSELSADYALVDRHRCAAEDVDSSGTLDLFCAIGANKGTTNMPNELLLDVADGGGIWASDDFGLMDGFGRGRDVTFLDLNGDQYRDLYLANEPSRADAMWSSNRLYRNVGGHGFVPAPEYGLDHSIGYGIAKASDLDDDGDDDLLLRVTEPGDGLEPGARVFINDDGHFVDRTAQLGLGMSAAVDTEVVDFDGDGRLDVAHLSADVLSVRLAADGPFRQAFELGVTDAIAMAVGDVDVDGYPDLYVAQQVAGNASHLMLVNRHNATEFISMSIPQPGGGRADDVLAIDHDHNGRMDFVTLNGWSTNDGPVKLTAFYPAE